jgi:hypothetical protein
VLLESLWLGLHGVYQADQKGCAKTELIHVSAL